MSGLHPSTFLKLKTKIKSMENQEQKPKSGMYGEMPIIKIGQFHISDISDSPNEDSVWIQDTKADDGGQFRKAEILPLIQEFYNKRF